MSGDSSNRRNFLKAMGLTAAAVVVPVGLGTTAVSAAPAVAPDLGELELWLLDTGVGTLDPSLYGVARQGMLTAARS
ncbi:twin-arginine translocation signal domain-containing protein [Myxococcus stipitatus]|uniref:twin-arginine translocation signal domain-containing protein n=1 Tax=Myxococcus stipitatus TaxID=83455 RepID=UPI001F3B94B9|nr:twin-arginine translocation signal domain-containing protein [Myxococcus stipitatus]MCE9668082.1 twin-arginine translocation signal domain-containing protein [Myxococcus stipitatus]